ncbi:MAG: hypothetical protein Q8P61_05135, partial [Candidatus Nanopelagicales bacterium]|nr:hypothetical protein [Candidatus Nanopelagicales bacterium]
ICAGVGFALGAAAFAALKEEAQRLNARLFGHRFLFGSVAVGGGEPGRTRGRMTGELAADALGTLAEISVGLDTAWHAVAFNASVQDRMRGTGVITRKVAVRHGAVGPAARASGVANDVRVTPSRLAYDGFVPATVERADGDVAARAAVRRTELSAGIELMRRLLRGLPAAAAHRSPTPGPGRDVGPTEGSTAQGTGFAVARVEGPRGETVCCVEARDGRIHRLHLRTASYANWPLVAQAAEGNLVGEFPLINKSFELCYACVDR